MNMRLLCVQVLLAFCVSVNAIGFHGLHFKGLAGPTWIGPRTIDMKWIEQPLDHFNHRDNRTWLMRYYQEDKYFNGSGPIFVMLGGEWTINPGFLQSGLMHDIAKKHGGLMFYTEHRYYGNSKPTEDMSADNLQYLSVDQALADVAYFLDIKKAEFNVSNSKVIVFGGSYAGNMAAWIRIKYPHLIQGAVASSAPVYAKADFYEYYEVVTASLARHDAQCARDVARAFEETEELLATEGGPDKIKSIFSLCKSPNVESNEEVGYFMNYLSEVFAGAVQYNAVSKNESTIGILCGKMMKPNNMSPIQRLAALIGSSGQQCNRVEYTDFVKSMRTVEYTSNPMRQWYFQTCTEFGYYQTANSSESAFGALVNIDFFVTMCTDIYGDYYERSLLDRGVSRTNIHYGGRLPDITHVVFVNGDVDPWHSLSVLEDLNDSAPAILIHGTSHCQDLQPDNSNDLPALREARDRIKRLVAGWVAE